MITRDQLLAISDECVVVTVDVPEWKGKIGIKVMTQAEYESYETDVVLPLTSVDPATPTTRKIISTKTMKAGLLARCLCSDEKGTPLFETIEEGVRVLNSKSRIIIDRLFDKAQEINEISEEALEKVKKSS